MKCPYCNEEIEGLDYYQTGTSIEYVYMDKEGFTHYERNEFVSDDNSPEIRCPECHELITNDDEEIVNLLGKEV